jgi:hypothetical protein
MRGMSIRRVFLVNGWSILLLVSLFSFHLTRKVRSGKDTFAPRERETFQLPDAELIVRKLDTSYTSPQDAYDSEAHLQKAVHQLQDTWVRQKRSSTRGRSPLVAVCMPGNARTFYEPVVFKSIKEVFLPSLSPTSFLFLDLKLWDAPMKVQGGFGPFREVSLSDTSHGIVKVASAVAHLRCPAFCISAFPRECVCVCFNSLCVQ